MKFCNHSIDRLGEGSSPDVSHHFAKWFFEIVALLFRIHAKSPACQFTSEKSGAQERPSLVSPQRPYVVGFCDMALAWSKLIRIRDYVPVRIHRLDDARHRFPPDVGPAPRTLQAPPSQPEMMLLTGSPWRMLPCVAQHPPQIDQRRSVQPQSQHDSTTDGRQPHNKQRVVAPSEIRLPAA
jgi:hypothetical protein